MGTDAPWLKSDTSGALIPPACRAWCCPVCGPRKAVRFGLALDRAGYDRTVTVTRAPSDLLQGVRRLRHRLAAKGPFEWAWSAERGPKTGMIHIHAVIRGQYWSTKGKNAPMTVEARRAGWGFAAARRHEGMALYAAKNAVYATKGRKLDYDGWRALNGGTKPWHASRGYLDGVPMRDWVRMVCPPKDLGPWTPVPVRDLPWWFRIPGFSLEVEAAKIWPGVQRATLQNAVNDAAEETLIRRLGAVETPGSQNAREGRTKKRAYPHAFAGMPRKPWNQT